MRQALILFALFATAASPAFAAQDRYGPPRSQPVHTQMPAPAPVGARLTWSGKSAAPQDVMAATTVRPAPLAPWAQRQAGMPTPVAAASTQRPIMPPAAALLPPPNAPRPFAARPASASASAPAPVATAQAPGAVDRPRFYSVVRQFGAEPDRIPPPAPAPARGEALSLAEIPVSEPLGRTYAPLDDGRPAQAVAIPDTKQNAASNRISRLGF